MNHKKRLEKLQEQVKPGLPELWVVSRPEERERGEWRSSGRVYTEDELKAMDGVTHRVGWIHVIYEQTPLPEGT
jgi:hypothetical protein